MNEQTPTALTVSEPSPEAVAELLDVVAAHSADHALSEVEQMITRLRANAEEAAAARHVLRVAPTEIVREALWLRAARSGAAR